MATPVHPKDIEYTQEEMGFKVHDITHLLPETDIPLLVSDKLEKAMRAAPGDYNAWVWDVFFMGGHSPHRVQQDYNRYFRMQLGKRERTICATQFGGSMTEHYFLFALAGENLYYEHDIENPAVKAICKKRAK